jgi:hypothetical protein
LTGAVCIIVLELKIYSKKQKWKLIDQLITAFATLLLLCSIYFAILLLLPGHHNGVAPPPRVSIEKCNYTTNDWMAYFTSDSNLDHIGLNFQIKNDSFTLLNLNIKDDKNGPDNLNYGAVYAIPYDKNVNVIPEHILPNTSLSEIKNAAFVIVDKDSDGMITKGDYIRIYADYDNDGIDEIKSGYYFALVSQYSGKVIMEWELP